MTSQVESDIDAAQKANMKVMEEPQAIEAYGWR